MQDTHQLKETIKGILNSQSLAVLATQGGGGPYGSLVAFAASARLEALFFATGRGTRKYSNLLADPRVAMVIDTRTNRAADFSDAAAVTVLGEVEEVADHERQELLGIYLQKHPSLAEFAGSPATALLRVKVKTYIMVTRFRDVQELRVKGGGV